MSKMGYKITDKNFFERIQLVTCPSETGYHLKKKNRNTMHKTASICSPGNLTRDSWMFNFRETPLRCGNYWGWGQPPCSNLRAPVIWASKRKCNKLPCNGKQGYSELSQGWEKSYFWTTNSWLPQIIAYNMVSCYTEFVLTVTKGGNLQWKHDITAKETLTTYWTSFDKWLMDFRGWLHVLPNIACTSYCSSLHFYERRSILHLGGDLDKSSMA